MLHLQPNSVVVLTVFAYLCEAYIGVRPYVALFRHFYSLRAPEGGPCIGCAAFWILDNVKPDIIPMSITKRVDNGFRNRWVLMDPRRSHPVLAVPMATPKKLPGLARAELKIPAMKAVLGRLRALHKGNLTAGVVAKDFVARRIAPLQAHKRAMWRYSGPEDRMRLSSKELPPGAAGEIMATIFGSHEVSSPKESAWPMF